MNLCLPILAGALLYDLLWGDPPNRFHPVAWMGSLISRLWQHRPKQGKWLLFSYGALMTICGALLFSLPLLLLNRIPILPRLVLSIVFLKMSFSLTTLLRTGDKIARALEAGDLASARKLTAFHLVSRNTSELEESELCGAVVESLAENLTDSFTSPLLYYLLAGLPGAFAFRYINTSDAMIGYRTGDFEFGGKWAARCDDLLNFIPARVTALLIILAGSIIPIRSAPGEGNGAGRKRSLASLFAWQNATESPNAGWTMGAAAAILGLRLEKRGHYVINSTGRLPKPADIRRCIRLVRRSALLFLLLLAGILACTGVILGS
ncbi:adenosylcobinamide-phosphate synthase CbiB [Sediminispirochaeta smaragdinae]|uniref:Cobalamin biosynthesis protein CobD n=1 Tax=Sediminispirochaeta smaragdinae (strain DSM 11293 / JCM 15392 / SEBR 4228) TaxID=573413 RepID=E1R8J1_SEDSS|nr:adenosylcobinamide-phosphate synthase CbiB [Sediminispirochaeta smaragdinae]ADK79335.1 cobalamin biosynthesis protein CobD [Sediminispirochaeta smaragdinae DSM 11293]